MTLIKRKANRRTEPMQLKQRRSCEELAAAVEDADAAVRRQAARLARMDTERRESNCLPGESRGRWGGRP